MVARKPLLIGLALIALFLLRGSSCVKITRPYKTPTAKEVLAALKVRSQKIKTLRAETRMSHQTAQGKVKATVRLMAELGGKLRFDAVSPFDTPLSTLVADGKNFALVDAKANRHYYGPATPCNLARLLRVSLQADAVLAILAGSTPLITAESATIAWDDRAGREILTLQGPSGSQVIHLDGRMNGGRPTWDLLQSEIRDKQGKVVLSIKASDHRKIAGLRAPKTLSLSQPKAGATLDLSYRKQELNVSLSKAAFELPAAGGLPSKRVDCQTPLGSPTKK